MKRDLGNCGRKEEMIKMYYNHLKSLRTILYIANGEII